MNELSKTSFFVSARRSCVCCHFSRVCFMSATRVFLWSSNQALCAIVSVEGERQRRTDMERDGYVLKSVLVLCLALCGYKKNEAYARLRVWNTSALCCLLCHAFICPVP